MKHFPLTRVVVCSSLVSFFFADEYPLLLRVYVHVKIKYQISFFTCGQLRLHGNAPQYPLNKVTANPRPPERDTIVEVIPKEVSREHVA